MAEEHRIDAAALLRGRVRVAEIHTVLDQSHTALLAQAVFAPEASIEVNDASEGCAS
jgi:hypothetical protein